MAVNNQELKKSGLKAGIWNFSTTIINQLRNFIVSLVLARLLNPSDFALVGMATVFVGIVEAFVDFGFGSSIVQRKSISQGQLSTVFYINLMMGGIFALTMFLGAPFIAEFFNEPRLIPITKVLSLTFIIKALDVIPGAIFKRNLDYKTPFQISITSGIVSGIAGISFALVGMGVWALVWSQVLGWLISISLIWIKSDWRPSLYYNFKCVRELWKFGYKLSLSVFIDLLFNRLNTIFIGKFFSATLLGLYYRACSLNGLVIQYSFSAFSGVLFPTLSKCQDDLPLLRYNVLKIVHTVSFLTFFFSGWMIVGAYEIMTITYGEKWVGAVDFFKILGLFSITLTIPPILVNALMCVGKTDVNLRIEIIKKTMFAIAIPIGLHFGIYGYVYATSLAALISMPLNMWALKYIELSLKPQIKAIGFYLIPFGILISVNTIFFPQVLFGNKFISLIVKSAYYALGYLAYNATFKSEGLTSTINIIRPLLKKFQLKI